MHSKTETKPKLTILLASPRGFCAGVDRAIQIVEKALVEYGAPVYVRHEIVHNKTVVDRLRDSGAVFVKELDEVPEGFPVIFSAHGVPKHVPETAKQRNMLYVDATCPLVSKVHREAENHAKNGCHILLVGHKGHPEVIGTMGQVGEGRMSLIETILDAESVQPLEGMPLAYVTQTTLSVDDTAAIIGVLQRRFPEIATPRKEDICYATTNRQLAVKALAAEADTILVVGAANSSNSNRLVDVAKASGCSNAHLIASSHDIDWKKITCGSKVGLTAGASAPEDLVQEVILEAKNLFDVELKIINAIDENVVFKLPRFPKPLSAPVEVLK